MISHRRRLSALPAGVIDLASQAVAKIGEAACGASGASFVQLGRRYGRTQSLAGDESLSVGLVGYAAPAMYRAMRPHSRQRSVTWERGGGGT